MRRSLSRGFRRGSSRERGTALVSVLLLLMIMSGLAAAVALSGQTETLVARNHHSLAQARAAAEAGLNRATQVTLLWLAQWPSNYATADAALDALLADPTLVGTANVSFTTLYDDELGAGIDYELDLLDDSGPGEDANATNDTNGMILIRATGRATDTVRLDSIVQLEALIGSYDLPALISDGDLELGASVTIEATDGGGVHANGDLTFTGANAVTGVPELDDGTATSTGNYSASLTTALSNSDDSGGGFTRKTVPTVRASFYRTLADFVLESTGQVTCNRASCTVDGMPYAQNATVCDASSNPHNQCRGNFGWIYDDAALGWTLQPPGPGNPPYADTYTFYVEGPVRISGSPGSVADPLDITIIAEGSIDGGGGSPTLAPDTASIMFVTDGDLDISGNFTMPPISMGSAVAGLILVHEQVEINASAAIIRGQIIIEDAEDVDTLVTRDDDGIQGVSIFNVGAVGNMFFQVSGWREVR